MLAIARFFFLASSLCAVSTHAEDAGFVPEPPNIQIAHLVPPGHVLLRWQPGAEPADRPSGWKISRYIITAVDTSTDTATDHSVYPPNAPCMPMATGECIEGVFEVTPDAGQQLMLDANKDGRHHYAHITVQSMRYDEYSFPRYTLDAGYYSFRLVACAKDTQSLVDDEWCSQPSPDSSTLVPVPGHAIANSNGDDGDEKPGVPQHVSASMRGKGAARTVTVSWTDPVPDIATAFVVLATPNNDITKRFAASERLYSNRREFVLSANTVKTYLLSKCTQGKDCSFTFQIAAINIMTHGVPSAHSYPLVISHEDEDINWLPAGEVDIDEATSLNAEGQIVVSWHYINHSIPHTGFFVTCFKKQEPKVCTGALAADATSFAFDRSMLEDQSFYSFQVQATNLGLFGPPSNVTDPVKTSWAASELTLTTPLLILQQPFQFRTEYANGQLRLLWSNPSPEFATRVAAKRHNETIWNILEEDIPSPQTEYLVPASGDVADYDFTVAAVNRLGAGPWSSVSTALLGARHPGAPAHPLKVGTTKRLDQIEIGWALPDDDGGMPIDKFKISVIRTSERPAGLPDPAIPLEDLPEPAMLIEVGQISEYVVVQLHPATSYSFRVAAHNGVGWSSLSEVSPPISTAALIAPESNYWVKRMKQALAICVTIFLVLALMCGGCIYFAYKQQEKEGTFDHQPNAWKEFKAMVDSEESKQRSVFKDDDLL